LLTFTPGAEHAGRTNEFAVVVTDNGQPPLSATTKVAVVVSDLLDLAVGENFAPAGQSGRVPLHLLASSPLTNLAFTLSLPAGYVTNLAAVSSNAALSIAAPVQLTANEWQFQMHSADASLVGTQAFAELRFDVLANAPTAVLPLELHEASAQTIGGVAVTNLWLYPGRLVVVGQQPLMDVQAQTGQIRLLLYEMPGVTLQLQTAPRLEPPSPWQNWLRITITNYETEVWDWMTNRSLYYRAYRTNAP
jgi:hypothetical protein